MNNIKLKGLFLDDERIPTDVTWVKYPDNIEWVIVRNFAEFSHHMHNLCFDIYSFDHDLQDYWDIKEGEIIGENLEGFVYATTTETGEHTGYTILRSMLEDWQMLLDFNSSRLDKIQFIAHTQNPVGKKNMECYYQNYVKFMKNAG